jgi:hypothetical protein
MEDFNGSWTVSDHFRTSLSVANVHTDVGEYVLPVVLLSVTDDLSAGLTDDISAKVERLPI